MFRISDEMATVLRRRSRRNRSRRPRILNRTTSETQVVDLTCTADDEVYDLTGISESPTIVPAHSPIVISDTPVATDPVRQTVESVSSDVPPFQLPDSETEELPTFPFIVSNVQNSSSHQSQSSSVSCPICLDSLSQIRARNSRLISTKCGHVFCKQCVDDLLKERGSCPCPTCRKTVSKKTVHPIYI